MRSGIGNTASDPLYVAQTSATTDANGAPIPPASASLAPNTAAGSGLNRIFTPTVAGSLIVKASAGNLYGYNVVTGAQAGYLMIFDSATVPAEGTVTPKVCVVLAANASTQVDRDVPIRFTTGIVMVFSSTGPFTKTVSATAYLAGDAA